MNRREFLKISAVSAAGVALPVRALPADDESVVPSGAVPSGFLTPNEDFYVQHIRQAPELVADTWKLAITGRVDKMTVFSYKQIREMSAVKTVHALSCIGDPLGGDQISNAEWTGISARALLEQVGMKEGVVKVVFRSADGYHTGVPIEDVLHKDAVLAYEMNGQPLPVEHGYPLRFLNPGHYGQKCPKWVLNLDLTDKDYMGYWETRGWSDDASVKIATRINQPKHEEAVQGESLTISGSAYDGGNHGGIERVQVSFDNGETWQDATIWASGPPLAWSLWSLRWPLPEHVNDILTVTARAITRDGTVQTSVGADGYPAGAEGHHRIELKTQS